MSRATALSRADTTAETAKPRPVEAADARRSEAATPAIPMAAAPPVPKRGSWRLPLMGLGLLVAAGAGGYYWLHGGRYVSVDDAYVHAAHLMVSSDISGLVSSVEVKEGQHVAAGDILFRMDPRQYAIALDSAKAQLAQTRATLLASQDDYRRIQFDIKAQEAQVDLAQSNFDRANSLAANNVGTRATLDQARFGLNAAQSTLASMRQQAQVALARLGGTVDAPVETLPQYQQVQAQLDETQRQLDHTVVRAPFAGTVTAVSSLQPGMYLVAATAALTNQGAVALVSDRNLWVDANVKETDLTFAKAGDPVDLTVDAYPGRVLTGHVDTIAPATGGEFSIIPAQNASGNWVKVVQRVPVRIAIDPVDGLPLRSGMSVTADIDTGHTRQVGDLWGSSAHAAGR